MTKQEKETQAKPENIYAYQLKKIADFILIKLKQIESGELPDASFSVIEKRLIDLSIKFKQPGEDILKSLAHHLKHVKTGNKTTIEFMRELIHELFEFPDLKKTAYEITSEEAKSKETHHPDFTAQRMREASLVHDLKKLTKEHPPKKEKKGG